jgi:hypothetical protein
LETEGGGKWQPRRHPRLKRLNQGPEGRVTDAALALVSLSLETLEAIAHRAAEIVLARLGNGDRDTSPEWLSVERAAAYLDCSPSGCAS